MVPVSFENLELFDEQYQKFQYDAESVDPTWRAFFQGWLMGQEHGPRRTSTR